MKNEAAKARIYRTFFRQNEKLLLSSKFIFSSAHFRYQWLSYYAQFCDCVRQSIVFGPLMETELTITFEQWTEREARLTRALQIVSRQYKQKTIANILRCFVRRVQPDMHCCERCSETWETFHLSIEEKLEDAPFCF